MTLTIPVAGIGYATIESIPIYHYFPGGLALRVIVACDTVIPFNCNEYEICIYDNSRETFQPIPLSLGELIKRARMIRADLIMFEGPEPLSCMPMLDSITTRIAIGVRSFGLVDKIPRWVDVLILDDVYAYSEDPSLRVNFLNLLYKNLNKNKWIEINTYIPEPEKHYIIPIVYALKKSTYPLHIHIADHKGGGPVRDLYEWSREIVRHVYIHNDLYPYLETYCPNCRKPIAAREEGILLSLKAPNGKCWNCKTPIPFYGRIREKTPRNLLAVMGGGKWMHPLELKRINSFFSSHM